MGRWLSGGVGGVRGPGGGWLCSGRVCKLFV